MSTNSQCRGCRFPLPADTRLSSLRQQASDQFRLARGSTCRSIQIPKVGLSDICLSYRTQSGEHLLALDHINLQVRPGEFVCIVGPSGCGKSTLLHLIAGLQSQTSGQILVDGIPCKARARTAS